MDGPERVVQFSTANALGAVSEALPSSAHNASSLKRTKFALTPGSIMAPRVHYERGEVAFHNAQSLVPAEKQEAKAAVLAFKQPQRLGIQPEWNSSVQPPQIKFPDRQMMHTISAYQTTNPEYNFRAEVLPATYKSTLFIPKATKFQFDESRLLSKKEKECLVDKNVSMNRRVEFPIHPDLEDKRWDDSTKVERHPSKNDRQNFKELTKAKNEALLGTKYVGPKQREIIFNDRIRQLKQAQRDKELAAANSMDCIPFTLSNMRKGLLPDLLSEFAVTQQMPQEENQEVDFLEF